MRQIYLPMIMDTTLCPCQAFRVRLLELQIEAKHLMALGLDVRVGSEARLEVEDPVNIPRLDFVISFTIVLGVIKDLDEKILGKGMKNLSTALRRNTCAC